ncbi:hypothetical protein BDZ91DRAFT_649678 [Kalaharituber pfeilii]|nr:hypothetical protein BDZ91DRAFT_649678 [Kalaharituber pfeilii]
MKPSESTSINNPFVSSFGSSLAISPISHVGEPLDLSIIFDSATQIVFKNLSRKEHENTKVKALEDLTGIVESASGAGIEEGVLSAWMRIYPRLSVDSSRRVRLLTHTLHSTVCSTNKKRLVNFMPQIVGPWLCATYDNDRTVALAAREALRKTFSSEKLKKVWEVYHSKILTYCTNIIEKEQVYTLSSDQNKNAEEAEAKFARVIAACISSIRCILTELPPEAILKENSSYKDFFSKPRLWEFAYYGDPTVRNSIYTLLSSCLKKHRGYIEPNRDIIAQSVIFKALAISQLGSAAEYLEALIALTEAYPQTWQKVKGKKKNKSLSLIARFISQGPQGAQLDFWTHMNRLVDLVPEDVIPKERQSIEDFLDSYVHGINGPTVPKTHAVLSWSSYFGVCHRLLSLQDISDDTKQMILKSRIISVYEEHLLQEAKSKFRVQGALATAACVNGLLKLSPEKNVALVDRANNHQNYNQFKAIFLTTWGDLENIVSSRLRVTESEPEAKLELVSLGTRWLELISELYKLLPDDGITCEKLRQSNRKLIQACLMDLESHKSPSMTLLFEKAVDLSPSSIWKDEELHSATEYFFNVQLPNIHPSSLTPSLFKAMLKWFRLSENNETVEALWTQNMDALLSGPEESKAETLMAVFNEFPPSLHGKLPAVSSLETYITKKAEQAVCEDDEDSWVFTIAALKTEGSLMTNSTINHVLEMTMNRIRGLKSGTVQDSSPLVKLDYLAKNYRLALIRFIESSLSGSELYSHLLRLEGSTLEFDKSALQSISQSIESGIWAADTKHDSHLVGVKLAQSIARAVLDYKHPGREPTPVNFLAAKALNIFNKAPIGEKKSIAYALTFTDNDWSVSNRSKLPLSTLLQIPPEPRIDLLNPLGGCVYLIHPDIITSASSGNDWVDNYVYHELLLIATYTFALIQNSDFYDLLDKNTRIETILKLLITAEISKDNASAVGRDGQTITSMSLQFVSDFQSFMALRLKSHKFFSESSEDEIDILGQNLLQLSKGRSPLSFYAARVLYWLLSELVELHGCSQKLAEGLIEKYNPRTSEDTFMSVALLLSLSRPLTGSTYVDNLRNYLTSNVSGMNSSDFPVNEGWLVPPQLVLLNTLMPKSSDEKIAFPSQRAMFLLRNALSWFELEEGLDNQDKPSVNVALLSETTKLLRSLVPLVKDVYGSHWKLMCELILMAWEVTSRNRDRNVQMSPMTYWSMKLYETLKSSHTGNDDFEDAFKDHQKKLHSTLIQLFESVFGDSYTTDYSLSSNTVIGPTDDPSENICYQLLARLVQEIPVREFKSMDGIYPLLRKMPKPIHEAAYKILHEYIPMQQEQISIDAALAGEDDEFQPQLTPELLSLVLETPSADKMEDLLLEASPVGELVEEAIRGCFLAWRLIFDHFEKATFKVKMAYTENLQEGAYLDKLLDMTFEFLGIKHGRTFEPSRDFIKAYPIEDEDWSSERSVKQLLVHLYYLALLHTPSLVKTWWGAQKNRQISNGVEAFTEKYLSPLIVDSELSNVSRWAAGELPAAGASKDDDSIEIQVKVSKSVGEVTINCPVEDQAMEMIIRLPRAFPLRKVEIEGARKVGFTDAQWKALQWASHTVIAVQGGSVIDAVMLFRKNVVLHFAGVEECAICYSIVGSERTLPKKSCVTCKKKFHAACLYKWFKTSNSSACPLCRSGWQFYGRVAH